MKIIATFILLLMVSISANATSLKQKTMSTLNGDGHIAAEIINQQIVKQAKDLEAVLISKMIEPMFPRGKESGLYGGGHGSDIYRHMMIDEYGKIMSKSNGLGIADSIAKDLTTKGGS